MLALGRFQGRDFVGNRHGWCFQFPKRNTQVRPLGQDHGPLDQIFELADITGPVILREGGHGLRWDCHDRLVHATRVLLCEVANEQGDVFRTAPQGRHDNRKHVEAVIEIAAKLFVGDQLGEIPVCGGHQANIHADGPRAPQPLEFLLLQNTKELGLQLKRDITDLVKEQRALVGQFKPADPLGDGAGEGTSLMAEQLAFEQPRRDRRTVNLDEGPLSTLTQIVDRTSNEFLASARLAHDQHSRVSRRDSLHLLQNAFQRCALPDDLSEVGFGADFVLQV